MVENGLIEELNALWMQHEGDYRAFDKASLALIAKAFKVEPPWRLQRQVSFGRILAGDFTVTQGAHGNTVIA